MTPGRCIRMFISCVSLIFKKTTLQSYRIFLAIFRIFQHHRVDSTSGGQLYRERGLAPSPQPHELATAAVTLAVPLLEEPPQSDGSRPGRSIKTSELVDGRSNVVASNTQASPNLNAPPMTMPTPFTYPPSPQFRVQNQPPIRVTPIIPRQIMRYDRNILINDSPEVFKVEKGPFDYSKDNLPVNLWQPLTHPEGALFFYQPFTRIFTDANVREPGIADKVGEAAEMARAAAHRANIHLPPLTELALELMDDNELGYYFVDHDKHVIFWFEDHESLPLMNNVRGVEHRSHVKYALESQYWGHIELFPNKRSLPGDVIEKLNEMVMHALTENITSGLCLAPFGPDEVAGMLTLMDPLARNVNKEREHSVWIVARLMKLSCNAKFVNFCGQQGARLQADQSLYGGPNTRPKNNILRVMNFILFGSPDTKSKAIHRIWVDNTIVQPRWKNFIDKLNSEWNGYTIFSTVMLAVDISFLAVPSVQDQSAAILTAYLSTFCAMGSLVVSLVLANQVSDTRRDNAEDVASFMTRMSQSILGLGSLALMFSLPFALLIWGMAFFGAALSIVIFRTSNTVTITVVSIILAMVVILAVWPIMSANNIHLTSMRRWVLERAVYRQTGDGSSGV